jgi:hypothetical protein
VEPGANTLENDIFTMTELEANLRTGKWGAEDAGYDLGDVLHRFEAIEEGERSTDVEDFEVQDQFECVEVATHARDKHENLNESEADENSDGEKGGNFENKQRNVAGFPARYLEPKIEKISGGGPEGATSEGRKYTDKGRVETKTNPRTSIEFIEYI